ncbi:MAG TPA: leucyl/phenylalanyl-tRNA--protein transferase [Porticoccaceae bacterium]|nr:leucyl/phenylalanyl-tRNA--protein transferase [Porticoccaceae bacterium]
MRIHVLDPDRVQFPDPRQALEEPDGLLAAGGNLNLDTLIAAYRAGIFPWYEQNQPILWWSPDPRAVIYPDQIHISRSLRKILRQGRYKVTTDTAFAQVIRACAQRQDPEQGTWITAAMIKAYCHLHEQGYAHSVECWMEGELAGGLYGVAVGAVFCGESMFSHRANASKIALVHLAGALQQAGFVLIDCQVGNEHLFSMGATMIERNAFLDALGQHATTRINWPESGISASVAAD